MLLARLAVGSTLAAASLCGQVYSPRVLIAGQPDASDLTRFAEGIFRQAGAKTPREKAEAVWRYFLTDGRFVKPGFWYHIAGWAYEEPGGEVLDPLKLLNSYGFGLCYQVAPLLEAVWKAGGLDARVWFLTGHTVAEVFYDGTWHYYDSDMMGFNTVGSGPAASSRVASVADLERDPSILLSKMIGPRRADPVRASDPWYPADVRADAIGGLAELFSTTKDNWLFPYERAPQGHSMDFVLRPREKLIRYFEPEREDLFYLPYKQKDGAWSEFPQPVAQYGIRTADGPRSQKDARRWATGRFEYTAPVTRAVVQVFEARSPWVIINAAFEARVSAASASDGVLLETSTDEGRTWVEAGRVRGPHSGEWRAEPAVVARSANGRLTAVSGRYGYLLRMRSEGGAAVSSLVMKTNIEINPRTLPALVAGRNELDYEGGPARFDRAVDVPPRPLNARYDSSDGSQGYWVSKGDGPAELLFRVRADEPLQTVRAGARFMDLSNGLAPDKFTAEVRRVARSAGAADRVASIARSRSADGPFTDVWSFRPNAVGARALVWPEVDRSIQVGGERADVYILFRARGFAMDSLRLAYTTAAHAGSPMRITHQWTEGGAPKEKSVIVAAGVGSQRYSIGVASGVVVKNRAVVFEAVP